MRFTTAAFTCAIVSSLLATLAAAQTPTSPETRAEMIRLIDALEKQPYAASAADSASKVMSWLTEAPDVSVTMCTALLIDLDELEKDGGGALATQILFAEARFILEEPTQAPDEHAVHLAGVEGVLRTYAAMKAARPDLKVRPMEKLTRIQADKHLDAFVTEAMEKCH